MVDTLRTWMLLKELRANAGMAPQALALLQDKLLRAAVEHAYHRVPFYRRLWDHAGLDVRDIRGVSDLHRIPIVTSPMVREAAARGELLAQGITASTCTYLDTSGSSGTSLRVLKRPLEERVRRAVGLRIWFEHGFRWRDVTAQFQINPGPTHPLQRFGVSRKTWISTARPIEEQVAQFLACGADVVVGTARALRHIARAIHESGVVQKQPRLVYCAGELLDADTRGLVRQVFGVDAAGLYGQTEVGYIAWQCVRHGAFHVNADTHLVEVLREGDAVGPGEIGTVVVTDLRTRTMPLLRYETADLATSATGPCPCGRRLPVLGSIEGRARSSFLLGDGRVLTTRTILEQLAGHLLLGEYRLYQDDLRRFRLELTPRGMIEREDEDGAGVRHGQAAILERLRTMLGDVDISITTVDAWPVDRTGKTQTVFSTVRIPYVSANGQCFERSI